MHFPFRSQFFLVFALSALPACGAAGPSSLPPPDYETAPLPEWQPEEPAPSAFDEALLGGEAVPDSDPEPGVGAPEEVTAEAEAPGPGEDVSPEPGAGKPQPSGEPAPGAAPGGAPGGSSPISPADPPLQAQPPTRGTD